jgi:PAS domain S-box-containing protein
MTGQGSERLAVEMMKLGAVDYLVKTLDLVDLLPGVFERLFRELETERQLHVAETALRESERQLREMFDDAPIGYHELDAAGRIIRVNRTELALLGYSDREMLGRRVWEFVEEREVSRSAVLAKLAGTLLAGREVERSYRKKDGTSTPVLIQDLVLRDKAGGISGMRTTVQSISERKQAEGALRESNKRLEDITFSLAEWVWEVDEKGVYTYSSQQGFNYFGPHREDVIGKAPFDLMPVEEAKRVGAIFAEIVARKAPIKDLENWNITKDGKRICLLTNAVPILDEAGNLKGYRGADKDITAQRAAEGAMRLRGAALEAAANAIVITDRQGIIEWANPAFAILSGWSLTEAVGRNPRDLVKSGNHDAGFYQQMWDTLLAGEVWHGEIINRRKDGALRTEEMTITPLRGEQGEISHFIAIKQDITDHKVMQARLLQAQRMEAIGTLAGGIAHDLNNILSPIMMVTGLVKDKLTDEGDRELLAMTHASAQRGGEVIKQLLIFSRGQHGDRKVLQPRHLIAEMGRMMRETFPREIKVQLQLPSVLWMIRADPTQVHQVLMNLCVNARDAMPDGGQLTVEATNVTLVEGNPRVPPPAKPGSYVVITVSDTGNGIPPQIKHLIFDPFFSTKPVGKGTGLGLSTVLGIVHSHGGFVDVDSTPNEGSTFKVYFPAIPDEVEAVAEVLATPAVQRIANQTILVVDDERTAREMTRILLERQHYRVLTAVNGEDALMQYLGHRTEVTLVLTDLMMPVMSGVNLIRALRVINPALKIIATSGLTETVEAEKLAALGVPDVLTKPCSGPTLLEAVHRRLSGA